MKKGNSWVGPKQLGITLFCGVLFLLCSCVNAGTTNTILPMIAEMRGWNYAQLLPFMSYGRSTVVDLSHQSPHLS